MCLIKGFSIDKKKGWGRGASILFNDEMGGKAGGMAWSGSGKDGSGRLEGDIELQVNDVPQSE